MQKLALEGKNPLTGGSMNIDAGFMLKVVVGSIAIITALIIGQKAAGWLVSKGTAAVSPITGGITETAESILEGL